MGSIRDDAVVFGNFNYLLLFLSFLCHALLVTLFEMYAATLLHYVGANGVEGYRQQSPPNAVAIARLLLDAGAEVDAFAGMYGGPPPIDAGLDGWGATLYGAPPEPQP